ncbi:MAG: pimB [Gammaproteobacteria bacterium]|jgi:glycosyltransferase involved in cell wall biosynthesis|nr:pimB [Gammaproteobacteria bacterium]
MKTAIICDWLITYAGSERLLGELIQCFPNADLFAVVDFIPPGERGFLQDKPVKTTYIQRFPFAKKMYRHYLPWMPLAIEQLDLSEYQLIISSSHAVAKGVLTGPDQLHISYVHSPMRYAWDLQHQYLKETGLDRGIKGYFAKYFLHSLRLWDQRTANGVDHFIANSHFIARRIWKTYRREAEVIYPPVDLSLFQPLAQGIPKEEYYVTASRLVPYKKIDLIVDAFATLPHKKLIVIGDGPELAKIKTKAASNIEILGFQPTEVLIHYLQRAKAFIFAAEEDFGLLPLEAQACGTPVIAYGKGGALETVRGYPQENPTGLFFDQQTVAALCDAISQFENQLFLFQPKNCVQNARQFSPQKFREEFKSFVLQQC